MPPSDDSKPVVSKSHQQIGLGIAMIRDAHHKTQAEFERLLNELLTSKNQPPFSWAKLGSHLSQVETAARNFDLQIVDWICEMLDVRLCWVTALGECEYYRRNPEQNKLSDVELKQLLALKWEIEMTLQKRLQDFSSFRPNPAGNAKNGVGF